MINIITVAVKNNLNFNDVYKFYLILYIKETRMDLIKLEYINSQNDHKKESLEFSKKLLKTPYNEASLFVMSVEGESMQPLIQNKALVIADLSQKGLISEGVYIVENEENIWIKQAIFNSLCNEFTFVSYNESFSHLVFKEKEVRIVARVLLTFTNL